MTSIFCLMTAILGFGTAINDIGNQKEGMEAAYRIFATMDEAERSPIDGLSSKGLTPPQHATGRIELKNVNFRYPTRPDSEVRCEILRVNDV
jgi:ABC-type multidrug transport system fused ATPase/permease subunit